MADNVVTITFDNDLLTDGRGDTATLTGSVTVNYTQNHYDGSYRVKNDFMDSGGDYFGTLSNDNETYSFTTSERFSLTYQGQTPKTVRAAYVANTSDTYDTANNPAGQRDQPVTTAVTNGNDPSNDPVCFAGGTLIRTSNGDVRIDDLAIGDMVVTASGASRAIRWIGHRGYAARFANANPGLLPVCIEADALADGVPCRDLWVSPRHALFLDGVLIPAAALVNGASIKQATAVDGDLVYWHVELDGHDVLLAENAPAESFVNDEGRSIFHNAHTFHALYPDAAEPEAAYCAPRVENGHAVAAVRRRLDARAGCTPAAAPVFGTLFGHLDEFDGGRIRGWARDEFYPDAPVCLDVLVDGAVVALTYADTYRPDLEAAGIGGGCHGFALDLPLEPGRAHIVAVRRSADGAELTGSPWQVPASAARAA